SLERSIVNGLFLGIRDAVPLMQEYQITSPFGSSQYVTVFTNGCTKLLQLRDLSPAPACASGIECPDMNSFGGTCKRQCADVGAKPFGGETFQTNLVMPEPCRVLGDPFIADAG
ncbi:MAG TPA: hypothetical protein VFA33_01920, partial [Bryobacteraceae bacterium]|nr:hypothetical protein [Bryobacteraceae bacterium]